MESMWWGDGRSVAVTNPSKWILVPVAHKYMLLAY